LSDERSSVPRDRVVGCLAKPNTSGGHRCTSLPVAELRPFGLLATIALRRGTQSLLALVLSFLITDACRTQALPPVPPARLDAIAAELEHLEQQGDWSGLEERSRPLLERLERQMGPDNPDIVPALEFLTDALQGLGRYNEAESLARRALALQEKSLGPQHPGTAAVLIELSLALMSEGRYAEAEPLAQRALAVREQAFGENNASTGIALNNLATLLLLERRYVDGEPLARRALAISEKENGPESPATAEALLRLYLILSNQGRNKDAEPFAKRAVAIDQKALGTEDLRTARTMDDLAGVLEAQGRYSEAEEMARHAYAAREQGLGAGNPKTLESGVRLAMLLEKQSEESEAEPLLRRALDTDLKQLRPDNITVASVANNLAIVLREEHRYAEAEPLYRQALAIAEKTPGSEQLVGTTLSNLGTMLSAAGRNAEAEPLLRRAVALSPDNPAALNNLATLLDAEGRFGEAQPLLLQSFKIAYKSLGADHPDTATAEANIGENAIDQGHFRDAAAAFQMACATRSMLYRSRGQSGEAATAARVQATDCASRFALSLWLFARQGGGGVPARNGPEALKLEAFTTSQQALQSAAGDAMARSAALTAARAANVGPQAEAYEAALLARDELDKKFVKLAGGDSAADAVRREALAKARADANATIDRLAAELKSKAPLYWDYRSPEPVTVAALQSRSGADTVLLHDDEALILFLAVTGKAKGLVFAVSKELSAWAQLGLTSFEIRDRVMRLRAEIDPESYRLGGAANPPGADTSAVPNAFDRQAAYELYEALLGDDAIQAVIRDKPTLLFVPSGALTTLPPGVLVTAPPPGGTAGDRDPDSLRATPWLLRSKAVALLPTVSSLRTLRQILPAVEGAAPDPLLVFADPDFSRPQVPPKKHLASAAARGYSNYFRDGIPLAEALDYLPSLPGTRIEGEALERALGGRPGSLLTGREASKAQLLARNSDGRLAKVRVLEFATHGLVAGDASDLYEPALALAAGARPQDELLLASEAATLKLHADWVVLSACNTGSPDAPEAQGLSGLSRAFFYAGGRSLLVSHWRVRDDVAPKLIPSMLLAEREQAQITRAEALRRATLAILDDKSMKAAEPAAWAPFTLIGEAARRTTKPPAQP